MNCTWKASAPGGWTGGAQERSHKPELAGEVSLSLPVDADAVTDCAIGRSFAGGGDDAAVVGGRAGGRRGAALRSRGGAVVTVDGRAGRHGGVEREGRRRPHPHREGDANVAGQRRAAAALAEDAG